MMSANEGLSGYQYTQCNSFSCPALQKQSSSSPFGGAPIVEVAPVSVELDTLGQLLFTGLFCDCN